MLHRERDPHIVYGLLDPTRGNAVYYVGMTHNLHQRFLTHVKNEDDLPAKNAVTTRILKSNRVPGCVVFVTASNKAWGYVGESYFIELLRLLGHPLTNRNLLLQRASVPWLDRWLDATRTYVAGMEAIEKKRQREDDRHKAFTSSMKSVIVLFVLALPLLLLVAHVLTQR